MSVLKAKKITIDVIYNLIASSLPIFFLQLIIQPLISKTVGNSIYGDMLTIISCVDICIGLFGSPFNNTRLLEDKNYTVHGDFNIMLSVALIISAGLQFVFLLIYGFTLDIIGVLLLIGFNISSILVSYYSVEFRLNLLYKKILFGKLYQCIGYAIGTVIFVLTKRWEFVFFFGGVVELIYDLINTSLWKEPLKITRNFSSTIKRLLILIFSGALLLIITYADKLIIYPAFGSEVLSIYYAATVIGKAILVVTNPIGGVLLSYITKMKEVRKKDFLLLVLSITLVGVIGYFAANLFSEPLIKLLYPNCYPDALSFTSITNATIMIGLYYSFCWPFVFRFGGKSSPLLIILVKIVSYLSIAIFGLQTWGIYSICYGNLASSVLQAIVVVFLGFSVCKNNEEIVEEAK